MSVNRYRLVVLIALAVSTASCGFAMWAVIAWSNGADCLAGGLVAGAALLVAIRCLYHIQFPHDHPTPRYHRSTR